MTNAPLPTASTSHYRDAPNRFVTADKIRFAYRELGPRGGTPLVLLNHWGAVLDNFDPRIVDGLAAAHHVIALDYRGIGLSGGSAPITVGEMAHDVQAVPRSICWASRWGASWPRMSRSTRPAWCAS